MGKANNKYVEMSNNAIIAMIGDYIKQQRLERNITQGQVALDAGVNRWTIGQIEGGHPITLLSLIQILRALDILEILEIFEYERKLSPIELVQQERNQKQRARIKRAKAKEESEW